MSTLFFDLETYCATPISAGTHRYAEAVEVMLVPYAIDDGAVVVHDATRYTAPESAELVGRLITEADRVVIHNSHFDRTMLRHALGVDVPLQKIVDTMAGALSHSLPGALATLCDVMGVRSDKAKDKDGKALINLFCKPRPAHSAIERATRDTHPTEWAAFIEYARLDVEAMRVVYKKLPRWNYPAFESERALWILDQKINDRGVLIDLELVEGAIAATDRRKAELADEVADATFGAVGAATQRDALLRHLLDGYGVDLPDLQASTLERRIDDEDLPQAVRDLLRARLEASVTSVAKYPKLRAGVSSDGRLRGTLQYCGAARTGRWAGRLFQPQNLPRPTLKNRAIERGIEALKAGAAELIDADVMGLCSSALRGVIVAPPGRRLVVSDLANIEGRMLAWLAGEKWKLEAFSEFDAGRGPDLYRLAYARGFGMNAADVTDEQRQIGKVQELALGYQGAVGAFATMAEGYGLNLPPETVRELVRGWRAGHPETVKLWRRLDETVREVVKSADAELAVNAVTLRRVKSWLQIELPSGRKLCYPAPKIERLKCRSCAGAGWRTPEGSSDLERCRWCNGEGDLPTVTYLGLNQYTRKWERVSTYGGKLAENITQAAARDVLAASLARIEAEGFEVVLTVHDEVITEAAPDRTALELSALLATPPDWAAGLPLAAKGFETFRYRKD